MQFVTGGPDIPDELLQAHEEGRVVFFCGAGISYPAGLPGFKGLVESIYQLSGTVLSDIEKAAFDRGQFDATLDLLERRLPGQRYAVRSKLVTALKPKLRRKDSTSTQEALLRLARNREGTLRLVTTNFDRIFHTAARRIGQTFQEYSAPMLPIPKNSRWDGLVYLHGLLPAKNVEAADLNRLVITSGDFGLAYLTERWASRFVSELFRNYVVCFVGYSINDPVLRYMMDALAADRMLGESTPQAWALGDCELGQEHQKITEWEAKGVIPILYSTPVGSHDHSLLHKTLHSWADTYRDGVQGKEAIVVKHAVVQPQNSTQQDNFVGRMMWALSDKSGLPAKRFAEFTPVPSLDWLLEPFGRECFGFNDLKRFGVPPHEDVDSNLQFSLVKRPVSYDRSSPMQLVSGGNASIQLDKVMYQLARWLVRYLDDPRLIFWVVEQGGQLHESWARLIEHELDRLAILQRDGKTSELKEIRLHSPKAIPSSLMRTLWRLLLSGRVKSPWRDSDLYRWEGHLKREGVTTLLRLELRELIAPKVKLKKSFRWNNGISSNLDEPRLIKQLVDWELVLAADHVQSTLRDLTDEPWRTALPQLLEDLQQLLRDALDLLRELGEANDFKDRSYWDLPSITPHRQNRGFRDWVSLIELLRDAWLSVYADDRARATRIGQAWFDLPYPTFKRLALFAASHDDCISPEKWVDWLLRDDDYWLWTIELRREVLRLFVIQGQSLDRVTQVRLEAAILDGPPREIYREDLEANEFQDLVSRAVWLYLAKLNSSGLILSKMAADRLAEISVLYPQWKLATNERDEFSHWMSGSGDPDYEDSRAVDIAPRKRQELVQWLKKPIPERLYLNEDTWDDVCRTRFFHSFFALCDLAQQNEWPMERWREALQIWSEKDLILRSWRYSAPLVLNMPEAVIQEVKHALTWWIETASKSIICHENILLDLCQRVLTLLRQISAESEVIDDELERDDPVGSAINHPIGHVTQALINLWFKQNPNDNDLLPADFKQIFSTLCDIKEGSCRHGRVILGSRLIAFFRVDQHWTEENLLPLFNWGNPVEAKAVWEGFLWSPRLYQPLLTAFKSEFLETANHYNNLGEHRQQFATFLTYAALDPTEAYTQDEYRSAFAELPKEGLEDSVQALSQALDGAADKREDYWKNRVQPFWQNVWPKSRDLATPRIAESLVQLVIAARDEFRKALESVQDWLLPLEHPHYTLHLLYESGLCERYPNEALQLLSLIITDQAWLPEELLKCLEQIIKSASELERDGQYRRLVECCRRRGM